MFSSLSREEFQIIVDAIEEVKVQVGDTVIEEGGQGNCMYVVESGHFVCTKVDKKSQAVLQLKVYEQGDSFGELALLYNAPRAATITARSIGCLWKLDRDTFNHIVKEAAAKRREKYEAFIQANKLFENLGAYDRM